MQGDHSSLIEKAEAVRKIAEAYKTEVLELRKICSEQAGEIAKLSQMIERLESERFQQAAQAASDTHRETFQQLADYDKGVEL